MEWTKERYDREITRERKRLFSFAIRLTKNVAEAEDVLQETLIRGWQAIDRFKGDSSLPTWLYRIMRNIFLDRQKRAKTRPTCSTLTDAEAYIEDPKLQDTVEEMVNEESVLAIRKGLPAYMWEMIRLYHFANLNYEQIAELKALPIGTVKSRLNRARAASRRILESASLAA